MRYDNLRGYNGFFVYIREPLFVYKCNVLFVYSMQAVSSNLDLFPLLVILDL